MFCIAAFILFGILALFSAKYRPLAKKAWHCTWLKIRLKPCDINFADEIKGRLVGKYIITHPKFARFISKWVDVFALIFVVLSIWSALYAMRSGLYLLVYDTCDPRSAEACSLGGDACVISSGSGSFLDSLVDLKPHVWVIDEFKQVKEAVWLAPDRLKTWKAEEYVTDNATYYEQFSKDRPVALEVIDPGCRFCASLFMNIKKAGFEKRVNLTYVAYAIPDSKSTTGTRFVSSGLLVKYLEALKEFDRENNTGRNGDWKLLEIIFTGKDDDGSDLQTKFSYLYGADEAHAKISSILNSFGYSEADIKIIRELVGSRKIADVVTANIKLVEDEIRTKKIPTLIYNGKRHIRVLETEELR